MSESAELEPWQQRLLTSIQGRKPGELVTMSAGRNIGKSHFTNQAIKRLMDDLNANPITDIVLSEGTVYGSRYHTVEPIGGSWIDMETWCLDTFGNTGSIWQETKNLTPEPHRRWYANNRKFWFKEVKDRDWFILRWRA
jgi:hypothetical protein